MKKTVKNGYRKRNRSKHGQIHLERQLQGKWTTEQVVEASSPIIDHQTEVELKLKLDHMEVKALLSDFSDNLYNSFSSGRSYHLVNF
ncbi:DUF3898 domain-containing protein [Salipaludibacillus neizhouensis]|uniref:DUF3898 domain-containing protein n=1 Tax=Salipaludibacillus neizhouensis TaxID=885475 RepID=UPI001CBA5F79|nr:DUF3898 domain-containing protein [Salipaludibacillus neizhouensis]